MSSRNITTSANQPPTGQDIKNPDKVFDTSGMEAALAQNNITQQGHPQQEQSNGTNKNEGAYITTVEQVAKDRAAD